MPYRYTTFSTNYYYHILNRGLGGKIIFKNAADYQRALETINYYRFQKPSLSFSTYQRLSPKLKEHFYKELLKQPQLVEIISFCLMPNHTHLLLKQLKEEGISIFMGRWQNSYARYFNVKYNKKGYFFESSFKAKLIEEDRFLWHISRYIHLNPSSASLISIKKLEDYPWSSLPEYLGEKEPFFTKTDLILNHFKGRKAYRQFVFNQAAYQKKLQRIKHLLFEK